MIASTWRTVSNDWRSIAGGVKPPIGGLIGDRQTHDVVGPFQGSLERQMLDVGVGCGRKRIGHSEDFRASPGEEELAAPGVVMPGDAAHRAVGISDNQTVFVQAQNAVGIVLFVAFKDEGTAIGEIVSPD